MTKIEKIVGKNKYLVLQEDKVCLNNKHMEKYLAQTKDNKASVDKVLKLATCNVKSVISDGKTPEALESVMKMYSSAISVYLSKPTKFTMDD